MWGFFLRVCVWGGGGVTSSLETTDASTQVKKIKKNLSSNNFGFIYADLSNVVSYKRNV